MAVRSVASGTQVILKQCLQRSQGPRKGPQVLSVVSEKLLMVRST